MTPEERIAQVNADLDRKHALSRAHAMDEESDMLEDIERLDKLANSEETPVRERIEAFAEWMDLKDMHFRWFILPKVGRKYTIAVLRKMIIEQFNGQLEFARKQIEKEYVINDERRAKGMTFKERREKFNRERVAFMERQEKRIQEEMRSFEPYPLEAWFTQEDYALAVRHGMPWVIRFNFGRVYTIPQR